MRDRRTYPANLPRHSVSAGAAVIRADGRALAIRRRDNGAWVQPGGIVELDEHPADAVVREVLEETGVCIEVEHLSGVYKNMPLGVISLVFRCHPTGGKPTPTEEAIEVAWLTTAQVRERMSEAFAVRILDALAGVQPVVRAHDGANLNQPDG